MARLQAYPAWTITLLNPGFPKSGGKIIGESKVNNIAVEQLIPLKNRSAPAQPCFYHPELYWWHRHRRFRHCPDCRIYFGPRSRCYRWPTVQIHGWRSCPHWQRNFIRSWVKSRYPIQSMNFRSFIKIYFRNKKAK